MKADSLVPPGRKGEPRGCGRLEVEFVDTEATEDGGGERMKPPDEAMVRRLIVKGSRSPYLMHEGIEDARAGLVKDYRIRRRIITGIGHVHWLCCAARPKCVEDGRCESEV